MLSNCLTLRIGKLSLGEATQFHLPQCSLVLDKKSFRNLGSKSDI